ncbi:hypothetical protein KSP40_PGU004138 [Platanthera guangdongensis]|uniref:Uncharacterized protein n=1 Tax=Platanthera guangdongensis TaxID=2320717 RepID=A0ABR2M6K9_9ASPA
MFTAFQISDKIIGTVALEDGRALNAQICTKWRASACFRMNAPAARAPTGPLDPRARFPSASTSGDSPTGDSLTCFILSDVSITDWRSAIDAASLPSQPPISSFDQRLLGFTIECEWTQATA